MRELNSGDNDMALVSPGVQVTIIDESFYTPAEPGTTPLIVVATAQDKSNGAGTGTATATTKANAGKAFRLTSQKDVGDLFGVPFFEKTPSNTPIHGSERNEYGLLAAYSYLGVSASAFIVRADVNLNELEGTATEPGAEPTDGAWWVDTRGTTYGIFEWNGAAGDTTGGQTFTMKEPIVLTDDDATTKITSNAPRGSVGSIGDYAVVFETGSVTKELARIYFKSPGGGYNESGSLVSAGTWVKVGGGGWAASWPTVTSKTVTGTGAWSVSDTFSLNGTLITASGTTPASLVGDINTAMGGSAGVYAKLVNNKIYLYSNGATEGQADSTSSGSIVLAAGTGDIIAATVTASDIGIKAGEYFPPTLSIAPHTAVPEFKSGDTEPKPTGSVWLKTTEPGEGARWRVKRWNSATSAWVAYDAPIYDTSASSLYYLDRSGGGTNIPADSIYVLANAEEQFSYADGTDAEPDDRDTTFKELSFRVWRRATTGSTVVESAAITASTFAAGARTFTIKQTIKGSLALSAATTVSFTAAGSTADAETLAAAINAISMTDTAGAAVTNHIEAAVTADNTITLSHKVGGEIRLTDAGGTGNPVAALFTPYNVVTEVGTANFYTAPTEAAEDYIVTNWRPLADEATNGFAASPDAPLNEPTDGQLWYNNSFAEVDMMIHNGRTWVGYKHSTSPYYNADPLLQTSPGGPIVGATAPAAANGQSDSSALVNGDLWISTADMENFPTIYKWDGLNLEWVLVDKTDQITDQGVLFADARWATSGASSTPSTIADLLANNYLDPDAPDPALYPKGMLLWNLRRSGGNVKKYQNSYIDLNADNARTGAATLAGNAFVSGESMSGYWSDRWTTESGNNEDGSGSFGRHAQRKVVVQAMKSVIDTSQEIRDEERRNFNLIAAPGYPETLQNLISLNIDRGQTAFVIGDTPLRLPSDATSLLNWGTNAALVTDNGDDGIVSYDEYCAVYYPNGFTTDLGGANAVVPASHMMLKTYALSDQVSYPWFAPAGTRRGGITNATSVGYIDALSGEFQTVALNEGTRDVLYDLKVNPIPFFVGVGLVAYGQKTRARNASALDRINVARLVVYLRSQLSKLARPYVFEPNDSITRDEIKGAVESLLLELVGLRALYDFAVVCDESNNTPSRVDRNELYVDIAIEPVKAVEFIYIPVRIKNTGEI
jgi:hypothetical protein